MEIWMFAWKRDRDDKLAWVTTTANTAVVYRTARFIVFPANPRAALALVTTSRTTSSPNAYSIYDLAIPFHTSSTLQKPTGGSLQGFDLSMTYIGNNVVRRASCTIRSTSHYAFFVSQR